MAEQAVRTAARLLLLCVFLLGCSVEPDEIVFGEDACDFCRMTIVDRQYAAQYVTGKGKQYRFDAIECMVNSLAEPDAAQAPAVARTADFETAQMIDVDQASYLVSDKINSPMGGNLAAFSTREKARNAQQQYGGDLYTWDELRSVVRARR